MGYQSLRLRLSGLRLFTFGIVLAVLLLLGVTFALVYVSQKAYFINRNFRILAAIGARVDESVASHTKLFTGLLTAPDAHPARRPSDPPAWFTAARGSVPSLSYLGDPAKLPNATLPRTSLDLSIVPDHRPDGMWLRLTYRNPAGQVTHTIPIQLQRLLDPIFGQSRYLEAFETVMLATADGEVWMSSAQVRATVRIDHLSSLLAAASAADSEKRFAVLAHSTNVVEVTVNGSSYKLFVQPCCTSLRQKDSSQEFVIAGLIPSATLNSNSLTISFSLVLAVGATLLILFVAWPFLKLLMLGETERITTGHMLLATASTVGGLALLTVVTLDAYAYVRLNRGTSEQLISLANEIKDDFGEELSRAYRELDCLTTRALSDRDKRADAVARRRAIDFCAQQLKPDNVKFDFFALIDESGLQHQKLSRTPWDPPAVNVASRAYFQAAVGRRLWAAPMTTAPDATTSLDGGIYIASVRSMTNGQIRAILASHTKDAGLPVATLTLPLKSLIDPIVLPGFQFAVIDSAGMVLFHSDSQRNQSESLFAETDFNRRLRALVETRRSRLLDVPYWGRTHHAFVTPMASGVPFTLVTLYDKQASWALQQEWILAAFALVFGYIVVLIGALAVVAYRRHPNQKSWVWPQPKRFWQYAALSMVYVAIHLAFWRYAATVQGWQLDFMGFVAAAAAIVATALVFGMTGPGTAPRGWFTAYVACGALGLSVVGIVPASAFFASSHDAHTETYTKYRQLELARRLADRPPAAPVPTGRRLGDYYAFFFNTTHANASACEPDDADNAGTPNLIPALFEDWLPYQSEASVEMRELLRDGDAKDAWRWDHGRVATQDQPCLVLRSGKAGIVSSEPSRFFTFRGQPSPRRSFLMLVAILSGLGVACHVIIKFVSKRLLLTGLQQPLLSDQVIASVSGENEWLMVNSPAVGAAAQCCYIDMTHLVEAASAPDAAPADPWLTALLEIDRCDSLVVVANVDARIHDAALAEKKLSFLEEVLLRRNRTIVLSSQLTPSLIANRHSSLKQRWESLLPQFLLRDLRAAPPARHDDDSGPRPSLIEWLRAWLLDVALWRRGGHRALDVLARGKLEAILNHEGSADAIVARICDSVREQLKVSPVSMSSRQLLDLIRERATHHYRELWATCTPREKLVLLNLAQDGLVNTKSRETVRRLMAKGLIRSLPQLALMNHTFEQFLLTASPQAEIRALEGARESSEWDQFRMPLTVAMIGGLLFFVVTQKELFDATFAAMGTVVTAIPAAVRLIGFSQNSVGAVASSRPPTAPSNT